MKKLSKRQKLTMIIVPVSTLVIAIVIFASIHISIRQTQETFNQLLDDLHSITGGSTPAPGGNNYQVSVIPGENHLIDPIMAPLNELLGEGNFTAAVESNKVVIHIAIPELAEAVEIAEESGDFTQWNGLVELCEGYSGAALDIVADSSLNYPVIVHAQDESGKIYITLGGDTVLYALIEEPKEEPVLEDGQYYAPTYREPTLGEKNALKKAQSYLNIMPFSYEGLIKQLEFEQYSHDEAVYGADNCGADWKEQAYQKALDYLDIMAFSRDGLIHQLEFEGFTSSQAEYAADKVGY